MRTFVNLLIFMVIYPFALQAAPVENGFCIQNATSAPLLFSVDAGSLGRQLRTLPPGQRLCTADFAMPASGFASVFTAIDAVEGCSRLAPAGSVQVLLEYQDFDRCTWQTTP